MIRMFTKGGMGTWLVSGPSLVKLYVLFQVVSLTDGEYVEAMHTSSQVGLVFQFFQRKCNSNQIILFSFFAFSEASKLTL